MRRTALTAGILYLVTFVSIPTLVLYQPVKNAAGEVTELRCSYDPATRGGDSANRDASEFQSSGRDVQHHAIGDD